MRKNFSTILIVGAALLLASCVQQKESFSPVDYVNPLMGTESTYAFSHGNTYPAVAVPWGMNFWSPQTGENGSGWMYTYTDSLIRGFRQTHQPSPWINDYGTFSIMPLSGVLKMDHKERGVPFSHIQEEAAPYSYSVTFADGLRTELSATSRGAVFEVTFPQDSAPQIFSCLCHIKSSFNKGRTSCYSGLFKILSSPCRTTSVTVILCFLA